MGGIVPVHSHGRTPPGDDALGAAPGARVLKNCRKSIGTLLVSDSIETDPQAPDALADKPHRKFVFGGYGALAGGGPSIETASVVAPSIGDGGKMTSQGSPTDARLKKKTTSKKSAKKKPAAKKTPARRRATKKKAPARKSPAGKPVAQQTVTHSLTPQVKGGGTERRDAQRYEVDGLLKVDIQLFGYQRDGRESGIAPAPDAGRKIHSSGRTVNLSISGMLARVADAVTEGSNCLVRFVNAGAGVRPELRWGLVVRCDELESGEYEVAVHFDSPLETLDVEALRAA